MRSTTRLPSIDNEVVEYDSEDDEIPELMSLQEIEESGGCIHVESPENEPQGLASLAIQTAAWPKTVGIDVPYEVTKPTYECSKPHRLGNNVISTDGLSKKNAHWMRSLLLVSRQFSSEVQKMIWESTVKRYNLLHHMGASIPLLQSIAFSTGFNTLSRVSLSMSNSQLFRLSREVTLDILTNLKLDHLHFDFQIPKLTPRLGGQPSINDPWRHVRRGPSTTASCQRKFVDLFFMLAYERLRSVPKVTFSGYIKEGNIDTWEAILAVSRKSVPRDMASKIATIMSMHVDKFPPRCDCGAKCHHSQRVQVLGYTDGMGVYLRGDRRRTCSNRLCFGGSLSKFPGDDSRYQTTQCSIISCLSELIERKR